MTQDRARSATVVSVALCSILFLFFFQLIADFIEAIYAFGLLGLSLPPEMASLLLLFSPLLLIFFPRGLPRLVTLLVGELMLICKVIEPMLNTKSRMLVSGLGVACFLLLLTELVKANNGQQVRAWGATLSRSLTVAISLSILLKAVNSGIDISNEGSGQAIGWILAALASALLVVDCARRKSPSSERSGVRSATNVIRLGFWKTSGLVVGVMSVFTILYFTMTSPNVIARWTGASYLLILMILSIVLVAWTLISHLVPGLVARLKLGTILTWNVLFVVSMVLTVITHQIALPTDPAAYPIAERAGSALQTVPIVLMLLLFPVVLIDFTLLVQVLADAKPTGRSLGGAFALASLLLLIVIFGHIFTTTYAYVPVAGPLFRDRFWLVHLVLGTGLVIPMLLVDRFACSLRQLEGDRRSLPVLSAIVVLAGVLTVGGAAISSADPPAPPHDQRLRVASYNILQGYDREGLKNIDGQLDLLRQANVDVIGLQECDTNRIAGGNADVVRYFADNLNMYSYYGPKSVTGTFGIALLSRYPIEDPHTFFMYSYEPRDGELTDLEQTATIHAEVPVADRTFNVLVTHLGNGGPMIQQQEVLEEARGLDNVILVGDFNFDPGTEQYAQTTGQLDDTWSVAWPEVDKRAVDELGGGIDHVFVSRGTRVTEAEYIQTPASDHPLVVAEIVW